jgi:hypothetical protein
LRLLGHGGPPFLMSRTLDIDHGFAYAHVKHVLHW